MPFNSALSDFFKTASANVAVVCPPLIICKSTTLVINSSPSIDSNSISAAVAATPLLYVKNFVGSLLIVFFIPLFTPFFALVPKKALTLPSKTLLPYSI